jgi:hypothetical protein
MIPQIPLGGLTLAFCGKSTSQLTPDRSLFGNSYERMTVTEYALFSMREE